jgi:hypothetical protein
MTDTFTPVMRALVAATLLMASATVMLVAMSRAYAAGALAIGACGAYGEAHDYSSAKEASTSAQAKCKGKACRVVTTVERGCAAFAVDFVNPCGGHGWGTDVKLGNAQNVALRSCYEAGGKECVIRTFFCDAKG